jgi:hypothetical protein
MKEAFKLVKTDKIIRLGMSLSLLLLLFHAVYLAFFYFSLPPVIPLFNQLPWGDERLGFKLEIIVPLCVVIFYFFVNYFFIAKLYKTMPLVSRIIAITTLLASLVIFIFIIRTLQLIL